MSSSLFSALSAEISTYRPLPSRSLDPVRESRSLRLPPSEPSPEWYGSLPRAWRSRICGVKWSSMADDEAAVEDWWPWGLPASAGKEVYLFDGVDNPDGGCPPAGADMFKCCLGDFVFS